MPKTLKSRSAGPVNVTFNVSFLRLSQDGVLPYVTDKNPLCLINGGHLGELAVLQGPSAFTEEGTIIKHGADNAYKKTRRNF